MIEHRLTVSSRRRMNDEDDDDDSLPPLSTAMLQADDEDDMMEMQMKSPFGSSFRTFNATDYKPIGTDL